MKSLQKIFIYTFFIVQFVQSAEWVDAGSERPKSPSWDLNTISENQIEITFKLEGYFLEKLSNGKKKISFPDGVSILKSGAPDLPRIAKSIIIPDLANMNISIVESDFIEIDIEDILPSKGNITRNIDPSTIPLTYGKEYGQNEYYPNEIVFLRDPHIIRTYRGQTVVMQPVQYNPIQKKVRVYTSIKVLIKENNKRPINPLTNIPINSESREFEEIYKIHFLNYTENIRYNTLGEHGPMLVICHGDFIEEMQPFVNWKNYKGIPTEMVDVAEVGDVNQMAQFISDHYNINGTAFVLLVGDIAQIESIRRSDGAGSSSPSDNTLSFVAGDDYYPDIMIGRFSGETTQHIQTMVNRTIAYEMNPDPTADWYKKGCGFGSDQGPGDDNETDIEHLNNIRGLLLDYTYNEIDQVYDPTGTVADGEVAINEGRSIINYTGHGSNGSWGNGCPMNNTNVNGLNNFGRWPFILSVACVNGEFHQGTCFAETWLRATDADGNPTGAIATLMSTVNQGWSPPMEGQDEMNALLVESYSENIKRTFGGIAFNGMNQMNDAYGSQGYDETFYWTIFGDPSVVLRTDTPTEMTISYEDVLIIGATEMTFQMSISGALVAVSVGGELKGAAYSDGSGAANITFDNPLDVPGELNIVVTAYNKIPYENTINIIAPDGSYMLMDNLVVTNSIIENSNALGFGSSASLYTTFLNVGQETSGEISVDLMHNNNMVNILNPTIVQSAVDPGSEVTIGPFELEVSWNLENESQAEFMILVTDGSQSLEYDYTLPIAAPAFRSESVVITDNGNGSLDPGETVTLELIMNNIGDAPINYPTFEVTTSDPHISIQNCSSDNAYYWGHTQGADNIVSLSIEITASDDAPLGHTSISGLVIGSLNSNYAHVYPLAITLGLIVEDFEAGNFSSYDWMHGGDADWVIHTDSYSGSFSAMSGEIGHSQNSELSIEMNILHSGELKFWAKASSEEGSNVYDYLDLYINNQPQDLIIGGDLNWTEYSVVLPEGSHTLQWIYSKDDATSIGDDCVWIDRIQFPPGSVPPLNINFGDVNSDDIVNILDVIVSVNYIIGYIEFDNQQLQNADMNLDGSISVSDILMIVESVLGD